MLSIVKSMSLEGIEGSLVEIQTDIANGLPGFEVVGLPDLSVKEAKERVKTAIRNSNITLPSKKILVNLAPADKRKEGTIFDLPIAVGILSALGEINKNHVKDFNSTVFLGELSLDGKINRIKGVLPMCMEARNLGIRRVILPKQNAREAALVEGLEVIAVSKLQEVIDYINGILNINKQVIDIRKIFQNKNSYNVDFSDVKGQAGAKRALEIAMAGGHNCILIGSPGAGKTMLAQRLPTILPDITFEESLEITKIYSVDGNIKNVENLLRNRPFRNPHHTTSPISMIGGGRNPKPGEISLAHLGILYLDELPEFSRNTLEVLRGPLEDKKVTISRINSIITYPCNFMFVASMNPCPCGYYGTNTDKCTCSEKSIRNYLGKISGPLLDRIDIHIEVKPVPYKKMGEENREESSESIRIRVNKARNIQQKRYQNLDLSCNAELTPNLISRFCRIDNNARELLKKAFENLSLSARAYNKILKISRTIADLEGEEQIKITHIAEAIQYRSLDRKYWNR